MTNTRNSRSSNTGLVSKVIAPLMIAAASLMPAGKADGEIIYLDSIYYFFDYPVHFYLRFCKLILSV